MNATSTFGEPQTRCQAQIWLLKDRIFCLRANPGIDLKPRDFCFLRRLSASWNFASCNFRYPDPSFRCLRGHKRQESIRVASALQLAPLACYSCEVDLALV